MSVKQTDIQSEAASPSSTGGETPLKWHFKLSWLISNIACASAPVVTIIYFAALYNPDEPESAMNIHNTNVHALNLVFVLIDHLLAARPVRLLHLLYALLWGALYIVFNVVYWSNDRVNNIIYDILDWNKPGVAVGVTAGLCFIFLPLVQLLYFGLYHLKLFIYKKLHDEDFR